MTQLETNRPPAWHSPKKRLGRGVVAASALASGLLLCPHARAQGVDEFGSYGEKSLSSAQAWALELRFGRYDLDIGSEFNGASGLSTRARNNLGNEAGSVLSETELADFDNTFFGSKPRYQIGIEYDWQPLRLKNYLSFGPGLSVGMTQFDTRSFTLSGERSKQDSSLSIVPLHLLGVLRVDALANNTVIPLVPYGKLGVGTAFWWFDDGVDTAKGASGKAAKGTSSGLVWALGLMLRLDMLEPTSSADLDATYGINHSYVFLEWVDSQLDNFGGKALRVGSSAWTTGIALEY